MLLKDLKKYIEEQLTGSCLPVDLLKIAKTIGYHHYAPKGFLKSIHGLPNSPFALVVDGECCLDRLYGGFFSDWICGGQWTRMMQFLNILVQTVQNNNIELTIFLNGSLDTERFEQWKETQTTRRKNINSVLRHLTHKNTPPPKVWWVSPFGLRTCLRFALRQLGIHVVCTMVDHRQEVIAFCRDNDYHGLLADDVEYVIFDPPRYFSSQQLKLTYKGSLETREFILNEISKGFSLPRSHFCFLAALLGNFILSETDLLDFYKTIIPTYNKNTTDSKDVIEALTRFIAENCDSHNLPGSAAKVFGSADDERAKKFCRAVQYYGSSTGNGYLGYPTPGRGGRDFGNGRPKLMNNNWAANDNDSRNQYLDDQQKKDDGLFTSDRKSKLPPIPNEVMRTASERHQKGLMSPWIYQVLKHGEVKFEVPLQDEECSEFPNVVKFYQRIRQSVYAVLYNFHHHTYMARKSKAEGKGTAEIPDIQINEWVYSKGNSYQSVTQVKAVAINWSVPTVQRLWFGSIIDDKKRRLRAFLSCVASDSPLMLNTDHVPQHLVIMSSVLRYIMSSNDAALLRKQELDSFIITAFSPELSDADYLQELKLPFISSRACQLSSLFMVGVEMVLFANDACGSPIPWLMCCPWLFFDGKLFHSILLKADKARTLMELCGGNNDLVQKVERCRQAILEGLWPNFIQPTLPLLPGKPTGLLPHRVLPSSSSAAAYSVGRGNGKGRNETNRTLQSNSNNMYSRGGQLQVAGVVVGSWGPNYGSGNPKNGQPDCDSNYVYKGNSGFYPGPHMMRNNQFYSSRGRPSVLAKRRQIRGKDNSLSISSKNRSKNEGRNVAPLAFTEEGPSVFNGNNDAFEPEHLAAHDSGHNNIAENSFPPSYNENDQNASYEPHLPDNANAASHVPPGNYNAYSDQMHFPPPPSFPATAHLHAMPPVNLHHAQNLYVTQSNGFKSPDSGVNVSILE